MEMDKGFLKQVISQQLIGLMAGKRVADKMDVGTSTKFAPSYGGPMSFRPRPQRVSGKKAWKRRGKVSSKRYAQRRFGGKRI